MVFGLYQHFVIEIQKNMFFIKKQLTFVNAKRHVNITASFIEKTTFSYFSYKYKLLAYPKPAIFSIASTPKHKLQPFIQNFLYFYGNNRFGLL